MRIVDRNRVSLSARFEPFFVAARGLVVLVSIFGYLIEEFFGRGQANIYMSSQKDARCFPIHADTTENFLFHVRGTVRWYIYNETEFDCKPDEATVDKVIDLEEGDLLYLPPKLYHRVETLGPRISISFHFHPPEKQGGWREEWFDWIGDING